VTAFKGHQAIIQWAVKCPLCSMFHGTCEFFEYFVLVSSCGPGNALLMNVYNEWLGGWRCEFCSNLIKLS